MIKNERDFIKDVLSHPPEKVKDILEIEVSPERAQMFSKLELEIVQLLKSKVSKIEALFILESIKDAIETSLGGTAHIYKVPGKKEEH